MLFLKIFKVILIDFVTKNKKEYKKEYKEYNFGVQRVHRVHRVHSKICTRKKKMYSFVLERVQSGHPASKSYLLDPA